MTPQQLLFLLLSLLTLDFVFDKVLDYLNLKHQKTVLPEALKDVYDQEKFSKSQKYFMTNARFSIISSSISFLIILAVFATGALGKLSDALALSITDPIQLSLVFFAILFLASDLLGMPFQVYQTFVIEEKFGFNKMTVKTFIQDKIKSYILAILLGGVILYVLLVLIEKLGPDFWIWFWIVISVFLLAINLFYTSLILPLFNKLKPLENGTLREQIEAYSRKVSFPLNNIFVMDGSKRSSKANAFFSGIGGKKKIVLFDTLIEKHSQEELVAVLAHEAGHFKKKHIIYSLVLSLAQMGIILFILSLFVFNKTFSAALGAENAYIHLHLIAFAVLYSPISHVTGILMNLFSRKNEFEADAYAATTYNAQSLQSALKKLSADNLSNLTPHPAYVFVHYSHPPLLQRLQALEQYKNP